MSISIRRCFLRVFLVLQFLPIAAWGSSPDSVVVFNELQFHPRGSDDAAGSGEWIELHNQMGIMTDVSGWRLEDGVSYTIPAGTIIPPKGYLVISSAPADGQLGPFTGALANNGERLQLFNQGDRLMDEMTYGDGGRWPVAADGSGATLAKARSDSASGPAENWTWSAQVGGTPGSANFPDPGDVELTVVPLLAQDAGWRFNESGSDLGGAWASTGHPAGGDWKSGPGVFAFEPTLGEPVGTALSFPALNDPYVVTYYFEIDLPLDAATAARIDHLLVSHLVDDGLAMHINGTEVLRYNLPAGPLGFDTLAIANTEAQWIEDQQVPATALKAGSNRISVEVHQSSVGSSDVVFGARLKMALRPPATDSARSHLRINEVAPAGGGFWVELKNDGATAEDASGAVLSVSGDPGREVVIAAGSVVEPGGYLLVPAEAWPFPVNDSDRLFLLTQDGTAVIDARAGSRRLRGRDETPGSEWAGRWLFPETPTPGAANALALSSAIVINEIFYNGPAQVSKPGTEPTLEPQPVFGFDNVWRYNSSVNEPGQGWAASAHPAWDSGAGLLGYDTRVFDDPVATEFPAPVTVSPYVITHYFETEFTLTAAELALTESIALFHYVDDGAVFYANGVEIGRFNMPAGVINSMTLATDGEEAERTGPIVVPRDVLVAGSNRISAEVHQSSVGSSDVIFGAEAIALRIIDAGVPAVAYRESDEQWIELFNRGDAPVDLSGWKMADGVRFAFPAGSVLPAGGHLVLASDREGFAALHPGVAVAGEFDGSLSGSGERLELVDAHGNPADEVRYYDDGRWPAEADGGGASLELRDPHADNRVAEAWAASDESHATTWRTYRYRGAADRSTVGPDSQWNEFVMGMLFDGEILIDDISVIEEPDTAAEQLIANVDFSAGAGDWRLLGNHRHSEVIADPDNAGNRVLRLVATGPMEHMHNHIETTLASRIANGREYEISFRARWVSGCSQLHTRLYFNRLPRVNVIDRPLTAGTPGAANSTSVANLGPTFTALGHDPVVPDPGQPTTIRATAADPDGVASMTLHYSVNNAAFQTLAMTAAGGGSYQATVPGQNASAVVHFYVEARDSGGAAAFHPAMGPEAGAAYKVQDGNAETNGLQNFRIVVTNADRDWMHTEINVMSNDRIPATVIVDEKTVFYDVEVRLKGSERARSQQPRVGFNVRFNADELFRGIHGTVSIDRSEGVGTGQLEMVFDVMIANSGGNISRYYDLIQIISPQDRHVGGAVLQLARYEDIFLDSQFGDGSAGKRFEYELIYYPTSADRDGYKRPQPDGVVGTNVRDLGDDEEDYRWNFLIKDDREEDDFGPIIAYNKHFSKNGAAFEEGLEEVVDVDNWLRGMAYAVLSGAGDNAGAGSQHNGVYYARPDGRVMFLPHDMDFAFDAGRTITANPEAAKIVRIPKYARIFYGHLQDIAETTYNTTYMEQWTNHFAELLPRQRWSSHLSYIGSRSNNVLSQVRSRAREVDFALTTAGPLRTDASSIAIEGTGWVNVRQIRLAGSDAGLVVDWTDETDWRITLPVSPGENRFTLEAVDFSNRVIGTAAFVVTGTGTIAPAGAENLSLAELHYHPADLTQAETAAGITDPDSFEFIELANRTGGTIDLGGVRFTNGIAYEFPAGSRLEAAGRLVLAREPALFAVRYPGVAVAGGFSGGGLANDGERITLVDALGRTIADVRYNDRAPWPVDADGAGYSLVLAGSDAGDVMSWRPSATVGGTPGSDDAVPLAAWLASHGIAEPDSDTDRDGAAAVLEYFAGTSPLLANGILFATPESSLLQYPVSLLSEGSGLLLEVSADLTAWRPVADEASYEGMVHNGDDGTATASWSVTRAPAFFRLAGGQ